MIYIKGKGTYTSSRCDIYYPPGGKEREVLGMGSIPVTIIPSCQDMEVIAL